MENPDGPRSQDMLKDYISILIELQDMVEAQDTKDKIDKEEGDTRIDPPMVICWSCYHFCFFYFSFLFLKSVCRTYVLVG